LKFSVLAKKYVTNPRIKKIKAYENVTLLAIAR
jgi:hypothetical protein